MAHQHVTTPRGSADVEGWSHHPPPRMNLLVDPWETLYIPKVLLPKLVEQQINSAQDLVALFSTEPHDQLNGLINELINELDDKKQIGIVEKRKFVTSVIKYQQQKQNKIPCTEQEIAALAKLNNAIQTNLYYHQQIEHEKQNISLKYQMAQESMEQEIQTLILQIEEFKNKFISKLHQFKQFKVSTLNEKATAIKQYHDEMEKGKNVFNANMNCIQNVQQRMVLNVNMINNILSKHVKPPQFAQNENIQEIEPEIRTIKQVIELLRTDDCIDPNDNGAASIISGSLSPGSTINADSICTIVPSQVGSNSIELNIGIDIKNGYDISDDNKEDDAIRYGLEVFVNNKWNEILQKSHNAPTAIFRLDGLTKQPYKIRIKYRYKQNGNIYNKYSNEMVISLNTAVIWNTMHHGKNVQFIANHMISCRRGGGAVSIAMDPMIISKNQFSKIIFAMQIRKIGGKSCFGFIDGDKYQSLMNAKWNECFLHCIRNENIGIWGLSVTLNKNQIFCCKNGQFIKPIQLKKKCINNDMFIFEIIFNDKNNNNNKYGRNYCNVYLNDMKDKRNLLLSTKQEVTFENIPNSIFPIYSHEDYGESEVSIKVLNAQFKK